MTQIAGPDQFARLQMAARTMALGAAVTGGYVIAAELGFRFATVAEQVTTVWAPTGISLAALLLWGLRLWPAIWLGAFIANAGTDVPLWTAAAVASGNTAEAAVATWVLRRHTGFDPALRRIRDVLAFMVIGAAVATAVSATIGVASLCAGAVQPWARFGELWRDWWLGDAIGAMVVAPAILTASRRTSLTRRQWADASVLVLGAVVTTHVVFGQVFGPASAHHPLAYVIFPFVIAAALRGGQPATALVVIGASAVTIWNTARGAGPFAGGGLHESLVSLQAFMGVLAGTGLLLAAAIAERETGERRRSAAHAVGEVLAGAADLPSAAPAILRALCTNLEWQFGALWLVDPAGRCIRCLDLCNEDAKARPAFEAITRSMAFARGVGLPGRVWATARAAWIENLVEDTNFPRAPVARDAGLHGAFGFPILLGDEVVGVIECFNRVAVAPDPDLLQTMSTVGSQIGQFMARKREEASVAAARSEAEAANRSKDEFLATLSHELRTPLNAIAGWTRMLLDGTVDRTSAKRALAVIDRNAYLLSQLVEDLLDVSRIITGGLRLDMRPVDLEIIIAAAVDAVRPAAEAKHVHLRSELAASARFMHGDAERLQQVVWNLLANAVKFTDAGGTVSVQLLDSGPRGIQVRVCDNGAGIPPGFLPHVFERFRQGDGSASRRHGGLGLGLAIVRHLVELHGGTVRAESSGPGKGSTFTVELPRADTGAATAS